jgi:histidinol-phosphate aminotransferase
LISSYPEVYSLYQKISDWTGVDLDQIYISAGSDGAIKALFEVFVGAGDEVITLHPSYAMYYVYSEMFGANLKKIEYEADLTLDHNKITQSITDRTKLICIANPNSPTGTIIKKPDLISIIEYAQEKDVLVLIDEAYYLFNPKTFLSDALSFSNLIVTRSFTKALGLASARLGFAVSNPHIIGCLKQVRPQYGLILKLNALRPHIIGCLKQVRPLYEVNSFSVLLGKLIIDNEDIVTRNMELFREGKQYLLDSLISGG